MQDGNREFTEGLGHDEDLLARDFVDAFAEFLYVTFKQRKLVFVKLAVVDV